MKKIIWLLFLFNGRLNRLGYWLIFAPLLLLSILNSFDIIGTITVPLFFLLIPLYIMFAIVIKRLHDINKPGWWSITILIPIIGGIFILALGIIKGTDKANNYGNYKFPSD